MPGTSRKLLHGKAVAIAAAVFLVAFVVPYLMWTFVPGVAPGSATGDDYGIRLAEVWPCESGVVVDAKGRRRGETAGSIYWGWHLGGKDTYRFDLIFSLPEKEDNFRFARRQDIFPAGRLEVPTHAYQATDCNVLQTLHGNRAIVSAIVPSTYKWDWPRRLRSLMRLLRIAPGEGNVRRIDVVLRYFRGEPGEADLVFEGPFEEGKTYNADIPGKGTATLEAIETYDIRNVPPTTLVFFDAPEAIVAPGGTPTDVLGYDLDGRRYRAITPSRKVAEFSGLPLSRLALVTVGEKPRERKFHNVEARYLPSREEKPSARPARYVPYTWRMLDALDMEFPKREPFRNHSFSPEESHKVVDIVRGRHCYDVWAGMTRATPPADFGSLDEKTRRRFVDAGLMWLGADDHNVRKASAAMLGVETGWKEFIEPLLEHAQIEPLYYPRHHAAWELRCYWRDISEEQVGRIARMLIEKDDPAVSRDLMRLILKIGSGRDSPAALEALVRLVRDERPWLWWQPLKEPKVIEALGDFDSWPRDLQVKRTLVSDFEYGGGNAEVEREARALLPTLLTAKLHDMNWDVFAEVYDEALRHCGREEVEPVFLRLLADVPEIRQPSWLVSRIANRFNSWYGIGVDAVPDDTPTDSKLWPLYDCGQTARDVLSWRSTGEVPRDIPEGRHARPGDMRLAIVFSEGQGEGLAALWIHPDNGVPAGRLRHFEMDDWHFCYRIFPCGPSGSEKYRFSMRGCASNRLVVMGTRFNRSKMPLRVEGGEDWQVVIEAADSPESILSGTKVFDQWWGKYGPVEREAPTP